MSGLTDTSVFCGEWPFRALERTAPADCKAALQALGVAQAWIAPVEGMLYFDPHAANAGLAGFKQDSFFVPVGVLHPGLPGWERDARAGLRNFGCRAFKLFPNYHGYGLADAVAGACADFASDVGVPLCIQLRMQDERGQHPRVKVPGVPAAELAALAKSRPRTRFLACGGYLNDLKALQGLANVWAECSFVETGHSLASALEVFGAEKLVFGSHMPLHYPAAAVAKLAGDETIPVSALAAVRQANALALLG